MSSLHRGLRRVLPTYRDLRRAVRQGRALMGAFVAAALVLAFTLAAVAAAGWGEPKFAMSKLTRAEMLDAERAAKAAGTGTVTARNTGSGLKT
jgi:hypothetical protein